MRWASEGSVWLWWRWFDEGSWESLSWERCLL